jgi:hypothetical protein
LRLLRRLRVMTRPVGGCGLHINNWGSPAKTGGTG